MKNKDKRCATCAYWCNRQAELNYSRFYGICTCYMWVFNSGRGGDCVVLDRENPSNKDKGVHRFESVRVEVPIGVPEKSRYCLITEEEFRCVYYTTKP